MKAALEDDRRRILHMSSSSSSSAFLPCPPPPASGEPAFAAWLSSSSTASSGHGYGRDEQERRGRVVGPPTPTPEWKTNDGLLACHNSASGFGLVSTRKLAACLWRLHSAAFYVALVDGKTRRKMRKKRKKKKKMESDSSQMEARPNVITPTMAATSSVEIIGLLNRILTLEELLAMERRAWKEEKEAMEAELEANRKERKALESLRWKSSRESAETKAALARALQDLQRERNERRVIEDVCDELAREMGEDKARVAQLKREAAMAREEVEEERRMLQMAEVWREGRVQMKLSEARIELEEKNSSLDKLRSEFEAFLRSKNSVDRSAAITPLELDDDDDDLVSIELNKDAYSRKPSLASQWSYSKPVDEAESNEGGRTELNKDAYSRKPSVASQWGFSKPVVEAVSNEGGRTTDILDGIMHRLEAAQMLDRVSHSQAVDRHIVSENGHNKDRNSPWQSDQESPPPVHPPVSARALTRSLLELSRSSLRKTSDSEEERASMKLERDSQFDFVDSFRRQKRESSPTQALHQSLSWSSSDPGSGKSSLGNHVMLHQQGWLRGNLGF